MAGVNATGPGAPITGLSHVQLRVSDVEVSARWYRDVLGLSPYARDDAIGYIALGHRDAKIVVVLTKGQLERTNGAGVEHLDHLAFAVSDSGALATWAEHLSELGIDHPGVVLEDGHPSLQLRDPDGVAIELVASE